MPMSMLEAIMNIISGMAMVIPAIPSGSTPWPT
jgi:hypothetical protein